MVTSDTSQLSRSFVNRELVLFASVRLASKPILSTSDLLSTSLLTVLTIFVSDLSEILMASELATQSPTHCRMS